MRTRPIVVVLLPSILMLASCQREDRRFRETPQASNVLNSVQTSDLHVGGELVPPPKSQPNIYEESAYAVSEGKRLYENYNCVGCHAHGGGGMGPPLMDNKWIYGGDPANIYDTITHGRPNGMPSFRGRIPEYQLWQIAAYVRSLSGLVGKDVAPGRDDHMYRHLPPESTPLQQPANIQGGVEQHR